MSHSQISENNHDLEAGNEDIMRMRKVLLEIFLWRIYNNNDDDSKAALPIKWDILAEEYEKRVYSITKFPQKRQRLINSINEGDRVLIAGCGSATYLQRDLINRYPNQIQIIASDFSPKMLKVSHDSFEHPNLKHRLLDTAQLGLESQIDKVISTNSIVPSTRDEVVAMYRSIHKALKPGGHLVAYFPSFSSLLKMAEERPDLKESYKFMIDFDQSRFNDTVGWQCWQTGETLSEELKRAGFAMSHINIESIGCESEEEAQCLASLYGLEVPFISRNFECFFVTTKK